MSEESGRGADPDREILLRTGSAAVRKSRRWVERRYSNVRVFVEHPQGGHFAALEQPGSMIDDIRTTFAAHS